VDGTGAVIAGMMTEAWIRVVTGQTALAAMEPKRAIVAMAVVAVVIWGGATGVTIPKVAIRKVVTRIAVSAAGGGGEMTAVIVPAAAMA